MLSMIESMSLQRHKTLEGIDFALSIEYSALMGPRSPPELTAPDPKGGPLTLVHPFTGATPAPELLENRHNALE